MRNQPITLEDLTIKTNGTVSNVINTAKLRGLRGITLFCTALALDGTITIEVSPDDEGDDVANWQVLRSAGSDINPAVSSADPLDFVGWNRMRVVSGTTETSDRVLKLRGVEDI